MSDSLTSRATGPRGGVAAAWGASVVAAGLMIAVAEVGGPGGHAAVSSPVDTSPSPSASASPSAPTPRAPFTIAVAARDVPATVAGMLGRGDLGQILEDDRYPLVDEPQDKVVHFVYDGTVTTVVIEPADTVAGCRAQAEGSGGRCESGDDVETLTWRSQDGRSQGVSVWRHEYVVSLISYDDLHAAKGPDEGLGTPPITLEELSGLARSEVWFGTG